MNVLRMAKNLCGFMLVVAVLISQSFAGVFALSAEQKSLYDQNILFYDIGCSGASDTPGASDNQSISGSVQELAQQILDDDNIAKIGREVAADLEEAASGQPSYDGKFLNAHILAAIIALSDEKPSVTSLTGNGTGHSDGSAHYSGGAVDFGGLSGGVTNGSDGQAQKIVDITTEVLPQGSEFGLGSSPNSIDLPSGFTAFVDNPNHVHIETSTPSDEFEGATGSTTTVPGGCVCPSGGGDINVEGENDAVVAFNVISSVSTNLNPAAISGIIGNLMRETGGDTYDFDPNLSAAFDGIAQWDVARWAKLEAWASQKDKDSRTVETQAEYIWVEMESGDYGMPETLSGLRGVSDDEAGASEAGEIFDEWFERSSHGRDLRMENAVRFYNEYVKGEGLTGGSPSPSGSCEGSGGGGVVNADGYALPVDLEVGGSKVNLPCSEDTCHHDGTPAADLGITEQWEGTPVYAIFDGEITNLHYRSGFGSTPAPRECISFQLIGDDGWQYWYGHIKNPAVKNGDKVKAGDRLADIGQSACADDTPPHLHIDRGTPKGEPGGSECCRDPAFVPLLDKIYEGASKG